MQKRLETLEAIINRLRTFVRQNNLKNSKQREQIIAILYKSGTHLSPEQIMEKIRLNDKSTSISSVYRILSFLEKERFINAIEPGGSGKRYEIASKKHHDHMICLECSKIIEFVDDQIEFKQIEIVKAHGATLVSHDMRLFIVCKECQKKSESIAR